MSAPSGRSVYSDRSAIPGGSAAPEHSADAGAAGRRGTTGPPGRALRHRLTYLTTLLTVLFAVPLAALAVPNTISYVIPLALPELGGKGQVAELIRMAGLTLPALMLGVPLAAGPARRIPAHTVVLLGLLVVFAGELLVAVADSLMMIGIARTAEGLGAGAVLPATVVLVWQQPRRRLLTAAWAGVFAGGFILATPLALNLLPRYMGEEWRPVLQPLPGLLALALCACVLRACCALGRGGARPEDRLPPPGRDERAQLLLPLVPAGGFALLALATTYGWSAGAQLIVAILGGAGLIGLAFMGSRAARTGSSLAYPVVVLTVGMIALPVAASVSGLIGAVGGAHGVPILPFVLGGVFAIGGALLMAGAGRDAARVGVFGGHALTLVAVLLFFTTEGRSDQWALLAPVTLLGFGLGVALAGALRDATVGSALFGVSMCFPAVLVGHLIVGSLQLAEVNAAVRSGARSAGVIAALTTAYRTWLCAAGVIVVVLAVVIALVVRLRRRAEKSMPEGGVSSVDSISAGAREPSARTPGTPVIGGVSGPYPVPADGQDPPR